MSRTHPVGRGRAAANTGLNNPPVWTTVPTVTFTRGVTVAEDLTAYVTDPDVGQTVTISLLSGSLPSGVTLSGNAYNYNGTAAGATATGLILRATDNGTSPLAADSNAHSVIISDIPAWTSVPTATFTESVAGQVNLGAYVSNYSAATDVFSVNPAFTQIGPGSSYPWLTLTGTGGVLLTADGTQLDADDLPASPGVSIGVSRSGGPIVYSGAFAVTVTAAPASTGTIEDFAFEGMRQLPIWTDPQGAGAQYSTFGKHTNWQYCPFDEKVYALGGDGQYPGLGSNYSVRFPRMTIDANLQLTRDNYYPYFGIAATQFPVGADNVPFTWDNGRKCFWTTGGFAAIDAGQSFADIGVGVISSTKVWRFWLDGPSVGQWEIVGDIPAGQPTSNAGWGCGCYVESLDCLVWPDGDGGRIRWYNCTTQATGNAPTSITGVGEQVSIAAILYDAVNHELIFQDLIRTNSVYAAKLTNLIAGTTLTTRTLIAFGGAQGAAFLGSQTPMWIRNRRLYVVLPSKTTKGHYVFCGETYANGVESGVGIGLYEVTLDTPTPVVSKGSLTNHENFAPNSEFAPRAGLNGAAYHATRDALYGTSYLRSGSPSIYRWSPPSWRPSSENAVVALTTDLLGSSSYNTLITVWQGASTQHKSGVTAWMSGCFARDMSCNGMMLFQGGGDQDYFGNEVFAFDFDSRRFYRLSDRCTSLTGIDGSYGAVDAARPTSDPLHFSTTYCEHGPQSGVTLSNGTWGLLPINATTGVQPTQPGVPHCYDGLVWVPGSWIGNERGALVRPISKFVYPHHSTNYAHYFDLDQFKWGRLTTNGAGNVADSLPLTAIDETNGIIYWQVGYINLASKQQNAASWWSSIPFDRAMEFDPVRGLLVSHSNSGAVLLVDVAAPGTTYTPTTSGADAWGDSTYGGIVYCSDLDCFFYYNSRQDGSGYIWKIEPPAGSLASDSGTLEQKRTIALAGTWTRTRYTMGGTTIPASAHYTYGNIAYVPKLKCIAIHQPGGYMYLYRPVGL